MDSILEQARREGRRESVSQVSQCAYDDGYAQGRRDEHRDGHINEGRWFRFGVLCGIALSVLIWRFWPW